MKKLFTLLFFTGIFYGARCQLRLGLLGGPHTATITETNNLTGWTNNVKPYYTGRSGLNMGVIAEMPITKRLFFQPGIFYMDKGRKYERRYDTAALHTDTMYQTSTFATNYIDIPLNITLKLPLGKKANFLLSAGPYLSFFYNGKLTSEMRVAINDTTVHYTKNESNIEVGNYKNKVTTFDAGFNVRGGFELGRVMLTGFISQGLTNFYNASYNGSFRHHVAGISVGFWFGKRVIANPDRDHDGVPDKKDRCPDVPGRVATQGCPDRDSDSVADDLDKCPDVPGLVKYHGCPMVDKDNDGVPDDQDKCPDTPGIAKYHGCPIPDRDGDGVNDEVDLCPDKPGSPEFNGCPIPDSDGDGVNDKEDKCPTTAGVKENNGCPVIKHEIVEKVNMSAKKIFFDLGSDKISWQSYDALNQLVAILKANPTLRLRVDGHTDNVGNPASNLTLSQKRADAVINYLIQKGIDAKRLSSNGYGQEKPVAGNNTPEGRAANRRVELKLSQQ